VRLTAPTLGSVTVVEMMARGLATVELDAVRAQSDCLER
jgi:hypothetical protein